MAAAATAGSKTRAGRERALAQQKALRKIHRDWCKAHPDRAAEERDLRKTVRDIDDQFGHVAFGTPETRARASRVQQGAMARLYESGAINIRQLGASLEIHAAYDRVIASAGVSTSWAIERVDSSPSGDRAFELLGAVWTEYAYSRWRQALPRPGPILAMIVEDCGIASAARRFSMDRRTAGKLLRSALDLWAEMHRDARQTISVGKLAAAHAALL